MSKPMANNTEDVELYNEASRIVGTAILKNDKNYADEVVRLVQQEASRQKLKLLAEVRERVIGEDEKLVIPDYPKTDDEGEPYQWHRVVTVVTARYHTRKELRNDQRTELTKLEAEL